MTPKPSVFMQHGQFRWPKLAGQFRLPFQLLAGPALNTSRSILKKLQAWGIPLTVFVRNLGPGNYDFDGSDSEEGIFLATSHLLNAGHKEVGFFGWSKNGLCSRSGWPDIP